MAATRNRLILTVGLPRAGKSTWARSTGLPIVNPDSVRLALHGQTFLPSAEPEVWRIVRLMVRSLFLAGHDIVILDATNTMKRRRDEWLSDEWTVIYQEFTTTKDECIARAMGRRDDLIPVIERMAAQFEPLRAALASIETQETR